MSEPGLEPEVAQGPEAVRDYLHVAVEARAEEAEGTAPPAADQPAAEPEPAKSAQPELEIVNTSAPEPAAEPLAPALATETTEAAYTNGAMKETPEPPQQELLKPILVGADGDAPVEKKRGWWRR